MRQNMRHFIVCISLYRTVKLHLYVCSYYGLRLSNLIKETTYLLTYLLMDGFANVMQWHVNGVIGDGCEAVST